MLSDPAAIPLSNRTLGRLGDLIRAERTRRRSRWRRLALGHQAMLVLAPSAQRTLMPVSPLDSAFLNSTAWRYVREAVDLLAGLTPSWTAP